MKPEARKKGLNIRGNKLPVFTRPSMSEALNDLMGF